jgi:MFS family permease
MWNKNFVLLWQGLLISQVGTQLFSLALLYWILETTGSATIMGLVLMAAALPGALLGPFAGTLSDNISRKLLIVWSDVARGLVGILFVLVLWFGKPEWALPVLFISQIVFGISSAIFTPAVNASVPDLVPKKNLPAANSILQGTNALTRTACFALGGFLYAVLGASWLFLVNGISYLVSAFTECFVSIRQVAPKERMTRHNALRKIRVETLDGLQYVWSNRGLRIVVAMLGLINFVLVPTSIAMPILVRDFLQRGPEFLGLMGACQAAGSFAGFVLAGTITVSPKRRPYLVLSCMIAAGALILTLTSTTNPAFVLLNLSAFGFLLPLINVNIISVMQGATPSGIRGRVMGVMGTVVLGLIPFSQGLSGLLIDAADQQVPLIYTTVGGLFVGFVLLSSLDRSFRGYLATDYEK